MIDRRAPVLTHPRLGPLYRNGDQELIGSIGLDPAIRPPRNNGSRDIEILLEVGTIAIASFVVTGKGRITKASLPAAACECGARACPRLNQAGAGNRCAMLDVCRA